MKRILCVFLCIFCWVAEFSFAQSSQLTFQGVTLGKDNTEAARKVLENNGWKINNQESFPPNYVFSGIFLDKVFNMAIMGTPKSHTLYAVLLFAEQSRSFFDKVVEKMSAKYGEYKEERGWYRWHPNTEAQIGVTYEMGTVEIMYQDDKTYQMKDSEEL